MPQVWIFQEIQAVKQLDPNPDQNANNKKMLNGIQASII